MAANRLIRWLSISAIVLAALALAALLGFRYATHALKDKVQQALGPESEVGAIAVGWSAIEVTQVRIKAAKGWPAPDTLRAQRIVIVPELRDLLSAKVRLNRITVEEAYVSALRSRDGRLHVVPSLLEKPADKTRADATVPEVTVGRVELRGGVIEFFDATVRQPPHKLRIEQVNATVEKLHIPDLAGQTRLQLDGIVKGVQRNGTLAIGGWAEIATRDSEITTKLRGVDLIALQPYLIKAAEIGVRRGSMDLDLKSTVRKNRLRAPGTLTLAGLELAPASGPFGTFMGMPRQAVLNALKNRNDQITLHFTLEGNLDDPKFSLNESFARFVGASAANVLGVSVEDLARGVGSAARGVGDTVRRMFGK